jgi:hypothetical protein
MVNKPCCRLRVSHVILPAFGNHSDGKPKSDITAASVTPR